MLRNIIYIYIITTMIFMNSIWARGFRVGQLPNGSVNSCANCHVNPGGGGPRNAFGALIERSFLSSSGDVQWSPLLASLDADNDGSTNGEELLDPYGMWRTGEPDPGTSALVNQPWNSGSNGISELTVNFEGMNPHAGQKLFLRVTDKFNNSEVGRTIMESVTETFSLNMILLKAGHSYNVDFFADHNGNGIYDPPPTDHAWRIELDDAAGDDVINFSHNTNFTDIEWDYLLTVDFAGMTPHVGQLLEIRLEDDSNSNEVTRKRIEFIPSAEFSLELPGIELSKEYKVEMYADLSSNGLYDDVPADHAWRIDIDSVLGDRAVGFTHNTDFKDVSWKYLYTLNFSGMNPHVGQMMELKAVKESNEEIYRTALHIPGPDFSVNVPQIEISHSYSIDFYSDHNSSGNYDAPPADHSWRLSANSSKGNLVDNFLHNTNFTDIEWDNPTSVDELFLTPSAYYLSQNYPNPFNPSTKIVFNLPQSSYTTLKIYNVLGKEVHVLSQGVMSSGQHTVEFDASDLSSGIFFYELQSGDYREIKKMVLTK